eukprot:1138702-Pelagomonas_calceolata.AAC.6
MAGDNPSMFLGVTLAGSQVCWQWMRPSAMAAWCSVWSGRPPEALVGGRRNHSRRRTSMLSESWRQPHAGPP